MYGLCSVLNKKTGPVEMTKAEVEKSANVVREEQTSDDTPTEDNTSLLPSKSFCSSLITICIDFYSFLWYNVDID